MLNFPTFANSECKTQMQQFLYVASWSDSKAKPKAWKVRSIHLAKGQKPKGQGTFPCPYNSRID